MDYKTEINARVENARQDGAAKGILVGIVAGASFAIMGTSWYNGSHRGWVGRDVSTQFEQGAADPTRIDVLARDLDQRDGEEKKELYLYVDGKPLYQIRDSAGTPTPVRIHYQPAKVEAEITYQR